VIERVFVVVLLGISILFMLVVLIGLLRESLKCELPYRETLAGTSHEVGKTDVEYLASHSKRRLEGVFAGAFSTTGHQRASSVITRKPRIKERLSSRKVNSSPIRSFFEKP
jgi:hypothetical protein